MKQTSFKKETALLKKLVINEERAKTNFKKQPLLSMHQYAYDDLSKLREGLEKSIINEERVKANFKKQQLLNMLRYAYDNLNNFRNGGV